MFPIQKACQKLNRRVFTELELRREIRKILLRYFADIPTELLSPKAFIELLQDLKWITWYIRRGTSFAVFAMPQRKVVRA
ncbi:MAG: hypothetical protein Q7R85_01575 [bacterium]|nr:hypothetical protein [bacterium]